MLLRAAGVAIASPPDPATPHCYHAEISETKVQEV